MINDNEKNDSHHSNTLNSVFSEVQMQMLHNMIAQTKEDDWVEDYAENCSERDLSWWSESYQYEDHSHQCQRHHWNDLDDSDDSDNLNESESDLSDTSYKCCLTDKDTHFQSEEIGLFNSHLNTKNYESDNIIDADEKIYFCDVHLFIDFFRNVTHIKTDNVVCWNLNKCLCDIAQNWYIAQLSVIERDYIWEGQEVEHWEEMLFQWFKCTQSNVMKVLKTECYTIQNIQNNHESSKFVLNVIHHAKNADMIAISAQLTWVWNHFDFSLQESIWWFSVLTTVFSFIENMKNMKKV